MNDETVHQLCKQAVSQVTLVEFMHWKFGTISCISIRVSEDICGSPEVSENLFSPSSPVARCGHLFFLIHNC